MKRKSTFTPSEISELRILINERIKADRSRQKRIREKMRRIGFHGSDFGIIDLQPHIFEGLISSGRVQIEWQETNSPGSSKTSSNSRTKSTSRKTSENSFTRFDPSIHSQSDIPDCPGNYILCLKKGSQLPDIGVGYKMKKYQELNVIYTGIAGKSLRKRDYRQHFTGNNAGSSTLRKSIGSLFGFPKIARDKDPSNGKTKFTEGDEIQLSEWMQSNLILYFFSNLNPNDLENKLIEQLNPPLNLSKNKSVENREFRIRLSALRRKK